MSKEYDRPMHTAEHVLNGVVMRHLGCGRCFSTHINPKKSKVDFRFSRPISDSEASAIEADVNAVLARHLPVQEIFMPRDKAATRFNLARLPESAGDTLRIICVGDASALESARTAALSDALVDACPCIGEHVDNTAECGAFKLLSHQFDPSEQEGDDGVLRLRFKVADI